MNPSRSRSGAKKASTKKASTKRKAAKKKPTSRLSKSGRYGRSIGEDLISDLLGDLFKDGARQHRALSILLNAGSEQLPDIMDCAFATGIASQDLAAECSREEVPEVLAPIFARYLPEARELICERFGTSGGRIKPDLVAALGPRVAVPVFLEEIKAPCVERRYAAARGLLACAKDAAATGEHPAGLGFPDLFKLSMREASRAVVGVLREADAVISRARRVVEFDRQHARRPRTEES